MKKKKVYYFLLLCCPLFYFCSDHPDVVDYESMQSKEPELLGAAKALLKSCGDAIPLSDLSGDKENGVSSRGLGHPTNSVPLWDESIQLPEFNGEEILLVPLKEEKKRYAYAKIKKGNEISRQFSTSFSRLIVRKKGGRTIAHVFTYLPERKYVKANRTRLDSLKYHPEEVGYEGFVLISSLNGTFKHGFLYEDGKATVRLTYGHQHTDDCTSCSHTEGSDADVRFNISFCTETLKSRGYSRGVEDDSEAYICSFCGQPVDDCVCLTIEGEYIYCDGCGMLQGQCVCDLLVCPTCNDYPCTCFNYSDYCSICGSDPCTCGSGEDECSICHSNPCTCGNEDEEMETEVAPLAKAIFRNSSMTEANWVVIENMLNKIIANCMGGNLYNAIVNCLNGKTIIIEFKNGPNGSFDFQNGSAKISLGMQMESNQLFHEMWHVYQAYQETATTWTNALLNLEIEAHYAQYLYTSSLPEYKESKWEKRDESEPRRRMIRDLNSFIDKKGQYLQDIKEETFEHYILNMVKPTFEESGYRNCNYEYSRVGLDNFENLNTLTINCL